MEPAALPAASTMSLPDFGGVGRCADRTEDGCTAAIAVRNSRSRVVFMPALPSTKRAFIGLAGLPSPAEARYNASKQKSSGGKPPATSRHPSRIAVGTRRGGRGTVARRQNANGGKHHGGRVYG